jgi:hypothetical protein
MPSFGITDSSIRLAIWDPKRATDNLPVRARERAEEYKQGNFWEAHTTGPAVGHLVKQLKEERIRAPNGDERHYLGEQKFPLYIRVAGAELFRPCAPSTEPKSCTDLGLRPSLQPESAPISSINDISNLPALHLTTEPRSEPRPRPRPGLPSAPGTSPPKPRRIENPLTSPKALQVVLDLSKEAFYVSPCTTFKPVYVFSASHAFLPSSYCYPNSYLCITITNF